MKPFRLITVERLRGKALEAKAQELHAVGNRRNEAFAERERLAAQLASDSGPAALGMWTGADLSLANNFRQVLRQAIQDQDHTIGQLDLELDQARAEWMTARGELKAVQALHERHRVAARAEQARTDQRELDEHAGTRRPSLRDLTDNTEVGAR